MKDFWRALGRILVWVIYAIVAIIILGIIRWTFKVLFSRSD